MKINKTQSFVVLGVEDYQHTSGLDTYKGIIVMFDRDFDQRIYEFLNEYYDRIRPCVKAVWERKGGLYLYCHKPMNDFVKNLKHVECAGDSWSVQKYDIREDQNDSFWEVANGEETLSHE